MAVKKASSKKKSADKAPANSEPKFPYTTKPASLRRLLREIPSRPKPPKFDKPLLKSWGFADTNDLTMLRVLKAVNLLNDRNEPTENYAKYMSLDSGGRALGPEVRRVYDPFFQSSHEPYNESNEKLKNLFNIHSGGGNTTIENQIQTFKALCENALFDSEIISGTITAASANSGAAPSAIGGVATPVMHINLHIHLPENKSRRDYEDIIESIGRYIFGRSDSQSA